MIGHLNGTGGVMAGLVYSLTSVSSVSTGSLFLTTTSTTYQLDKVLELTSSDSDSDDNVEIVDNADKMSDEFPDNDAVMSKSRDDDSTDKELNILSGLGASNTTN